MGTIKKPLSSVAALKSGEGEEEQGEALLQGDFITERKRSQEECLLEKYLRQGADQAIKADVLADLIGVNKRQIGIIVSKARENDAIILSSGDGYFLPSEGEKGREEAKHFINSVSKRAANTFAALQSAKRFLSIVPGQQIIEGGGMVDKIRNDQEYSKSVNASGGS